MRIGTALTTVSFFALALAACGNDFSQPDEPVTGETPAAIDSAAPAGGEAVTADGDTPEAAATATPTPSASATPSPTPTPAPVASMAEPAGFATCKVCHSTAPGQNGIGPSLAGVFGRRAGTVPGFSYSPAMQGANLTWNQANLDRYLADPNAVVPGTPMPAPGLDAAGRRAVIEYLKTL